MHDDHEARRRKVLGIGVALAAAALVEPAGAQTKKVPKADAQYQDKPKNGQECENCVQFTAPSSC